ncbi:MAG: NADH:flavin oxidoreductase/NADH oxidase family protein [Candidatus Corynebacterium faecigallinarum]|uniref:NADH:flavin oxidoreductase/NADH oxidase family protein n=1 Tax=Candidatus Corynebacterium faecigallinarum TaxID=2838528 RepID=UPI003FB7AD10
MTPVTVAAPLELPCGTTVKNRLVKAAMSEGLATPSGGPSDQHIDLYRRWAEGGAGVLVTGAVMVDPEHLGEPNTVVVADDRHLDALREWAEAGTANDTQLWMQLNHPGKQSPRSVNKYPVAPSVVPMEGPAERFFATPRELTVDDIKLIVWRFGYAARIAQSTGFTGVQIHAAHGYLINQFLSPNDNKRTDEYGGDLESRMRLLVEIYEAIRDEVGVEFPISVKLNSSDGVSGGFDEDESLVVAEKLSELGVDVIEVSGGTYTAPLMQGEKVDASGDTGEIYFGDYAKQLRDKVATPVLLTGGFRCAADIERGLDGLADLIGMARPLVMVPEYPNELIKQGSRKLVRLPRLSTGSKKLDEPLEHLLGTNWYEMQMDRITDGRAIGGDGLATLWFTLKNHGLTGLLSSRR